MVQKVHLDASIAAALAPDAMSADDARRGKRKMAMKLLLDIELAHDDFVYEPADVFNPGPYTRYHHDFDDHTVPDVGMSTLGHQTLLAMFARFNDCMEMLRDEVKRKPRYVTAAYAHIATLRTSLRVYFKATRTLGLWELADDDGVESDMDFPSVSTVDGEEHDTPFQHAISQVAAGLLHLEREMLSISTVEILSFSTETLSSSTEALSKKADSDKRKEEVLGVIKAITGWSALARREDIRARCAKDELFESDLSAAYCRRELDEISESGTVKANTASEDIGLVNQVRELTFDLKKVFYSGYFPYSWMSDETFNLSLNNMWKELSLTCHMYALRINDLGCLWRKSRVTQAVDELEQKLLARLKKQHVPKPEEFVSSDPRALIDILDMICEEKRDLESLLLKTKVPNDIYLPTDAVMLDHLQRARRTMVGITADERGPIEGWYMKSNKMLPRKQIYRRFVASFWLRKCDEVRWREVKDYTKPSCEDAHLMSIDRHLFPVHNPADRESLMKEFAMYEDVAQHKKFFPDDWSDDDARAMRRIFKNDSVLILGISGAEYLNFLERHDMEGSYEYLILRALAERIFGALGYWAVRDLGEMHLRTRYSLQEREDLEQPAYKHLIKHETQRSLRFKHVLPDKQSPVVAIRP